MKIICIIKFDNMRIRALYTIIAYSLATTLICTRANTPFDKKECVIINYYMTDLGGFECHV